MHNAKKKFRFHWQSFLSGDYPMELHWGLPHGTPLKRKDSWSLSTQASYYSDHQISAKIRQKNEKVMQTIFA